MRIFCQIAIAVLTFYTESLRDIRAISSMPLGSSIQTSVCLYLSVYNYKPEQMCSECVYVCVLCQIGHIFR